jgi:hypothetical protein
MLSSQEEVKNQLLEEIEQLKTATYPDDLVAEIAEAMVPVYYREILIEWLELETEHQDQWKEYGFDTQKNEGGILDLMLIDLSFYYLHTAQDAWIEIKNELQLQEGNA